MEENRTGKTNMRLFSKKIPAFLLLLAVYGLTIVLRAGLFRSADGKDEWSPFYISEAAIHLRYASLISREGRLPSVDAKAEFPEGYAIRNRSDTFQEFPVGGLHRTPFFRKIPIHRFVEYSSWALSGLTVFAVFFFGLLLTGKWPQALLASLAYAVAAPAVVRTVNGMFIREILALPLIFFHFVLILKSLEKEDRFSRFAPWLAGLLQLFIVASWQMWRFIWLILLGFLLFSWIRRGEIRKKIEKTVLIHSLFLFLAVLLVPYMRTQGGLAEVPVILTLGLSLFFLLGRKIPLLPAGLAGTALAAGLFFLVPTTREHNYIFTLLLLKLRWLLAKPPDPALLPPLVRLLWTGPFDSPSAFRILYLIGSFWIFGIIAAAGTAKKFFRGKSSVAEDGLLWMLAAYTAGFLFAERLSVFLIFFLSASLAVILTDILPHKRPLKTAILLCLLSLIGLEAVKTIRINGPHLLFGKTLERLDLLEPNREFFPRTDSVRDLLGTIRTNLPADAAVLARYPLSASILHYTERPVFLSPLYDPRVAGRILTFSQALFGPEEALYRLCRTNRVDFIIHEAASCMLDNVQSDRYLFDRLVPTENETVLLMQYAPEKLKHFLLIHQTPFYRIYRRRDAAGPEPDPTLRRRYPLYNPDLPERTGIDANDLFLFFQQADRLAHQAGRFHQARRFEEADRLYGQALAFFPLHAEALVNKGRLLLAGRKTAEAAEYFEAAFREDPYPDARYGVALGLLLKGNAKEAENHLRQILKENPCHAAGLSNLIHLTSTSGRMPEAIRLAEKLHACGVNREFSARILADLYRKTDQTRSPGRSREKTP